MPLPSNGASLGRTSAVGGRSLGRGLSRVNPETLYRTEALRERANAREGGDIVRLSREWIGLTYWLLVIVLGSAFGFAKVTRVHDWAEGPALVRMTGRAALTATVEGTVAEVLVQAGQHVDAHQLLVRFVGTQEQHDLDSAASEFQASLVQVLRDPSDEVTRRDLARLRAQKEVAQTRLADRSVRAPRAGIVTELRIHPHQRLQPGDIVLTLASDQARPQLVALLPGHARPQLRPGMTMRFAPAGFEFAYQDLVIDSVGDEVLGPAEVRRYLGAELADAVPVSGPSVIVSATLPSLRFTSDHRQYSVSHGLAGQASARLRTRTVLRMLMNWLRGWLKPSSSAATTKEGDNAK
jgi:membrane fusion protein (multidrug efflux system)